MKTIAEIASRLEGYNVRVDGTVRAGDLEGPLLEIKLQEDMIEDFWLDKTPTSRLKEMLIDGTIPEDCCKIL